MNIPVALTILTLIVLGVELMLMILILLTEEAKWRDDSMKGGDDPDEEDPDADSDS